MTLFWKIFLGFWLTVVLTAVSSFWIVNLLRQGNDISLHGYLASEFNALQENLRQGGSTALLLHSWQYIENPEEIVVATEDNQLLWPKSGSDYAMDLFPALTYENPTLKDIHQNILSVGILVHTEDGELLKIIARQPLPPTQKQWLLIVIALLVSVVVCGVIARAIVMPLRRLGRTAGQLADGDLEARVNISASILGRDDLDKLATDFNHMAEKLKQSIAAHKQLLHDVSHELRSPLTRIRISVELARSKNNNMNPSIDQALLRVDKECGQLNELISEILSIPQLDEKNITLNEQVDIFTLLEDKVDATQIEAEASFVKLDLDIFDRDLSSAILINGKAALLARAIDNLLNNALRYSPKYGVIHIKSYRDDFSVVVSVQDQGDGVPEADLDRIFEPFVRVESARERRGNGGFGLGLALVKKIALAHGGSVSACNMHPGLRVNIHLPCVSQP